MCVKDKVLALVGACTDDELLERIYNLMEVKCDEPWLMIDDASRHCLYPLKEREIYNMWEKQCSMFWVAAEINFVTDAATWEKLSPEERRYFAIILAFFASADNIVMENLMERFQHEIKHPEVLQFFAIQAGIESVHVDTYNRCIDAVITDPVEKIKLFEAIKHDPIIQAKTNWMKKWVSSNASFAQRVFAWILVEGIFFSSSFLAIFYGRRKKYFPGIGYANEKISEDEGLHVRTGILIYKRCENKLSDETMQEMTQSAVALEQQFGKDALRVDLLGLNVKQMNIHVQSVADLIYDLLGKKPLYNVVTPFDWMVGMSIVGKSNFFEKQTAEYVKAPTGTHSVTGENDDLDF